MSNENQTENNNNNEIIKKNEKELNDLLKKFDETSESPVVQAQQPAMEKGKDEIIQEVTEKIIMSLSSFSRMVARHTQVPEIELTEEDQKDLHGALQPLVEMLVDYAEYIKYLPLITFVIGYGVRVADGFKKKKQNTGLIRGETPYEKLPEITEKQPEKPKEPEKQPENTTNKPENPEKVNENVEKQAEKSEQKTENQPENTEKQSENTEKIAEKPEPEKTA